MKICTASGIACADLAGALDLDLEHHRHAACGRALELAAQRAVAVSGVVGVLDEARPRAAAVELIAREEVVVERRPARPVAARASSPTPRARAPAGCASRPAISVPLPTPEGPVITNTRAMRRTLEATPAESDCKPAALAKASGGAENELGALALGEPADRLARRDPAVCEDLVDLHAAVLAERRAACRRPSPSRGTRRVQQQRWIERRPAFRSRLSWRAGCESRWRARARPCAEVRSLGRSRAAIAGSWDESCTAGAVSVAIAMGGECTRTADAV